DRDPRAHRADPRAHRLRLRRRPDHSGRRHDHRAHDRPAHAARRHGAVRHSVGVALAHRRRLPRHAAVPRAVPRRAPRDRALPGRDLVAAGGARTMTTPRRRSVLVALIGQGVTPSLTPPMHEREGARHGLNYVYRTVDISPDRATQAWLREMLDAARAFGFDGLNVTHPIKQAIVPLLDELAPDAERVGAVNTIRFADGRAVGHNTDVT